MYAKVFRSLFYGSLSGQADPQLVLVCLLTHCDADGHVELPPSVISALTGLPHDRVLAAIALLEAPDPASRSDGQAGRRLEPGGPGRWLIVNYEKYRSMRDEDERRRQAREGMRRHRAGRVIHDYPDVSHGYPPLAQAEAEVEADTPTPLAAAAAVGGGDGNGNGQMTLIPGGEETPRQWAEGFTEFWKEYPRKVKREEAFKSYMKLRPRTQETYDLLFAGLEHWKLGEWESRPPDKVEHASTWLNNRRFTDAKAQR